MEVRDFSKRTPESQEAILNKFRCGKCRKFVWGVIREIENDDGEIYFEVNCQNCGRKCRLYLRDVP